MHLLLVILLLLLPLQPVGATRVRLLLRDATDLGVPGSTLMLRTEGGTMVPVVTDARGVAESGNLGVTAVTLMSGQSVSGQVLVADSYPVGAGFRLVLTPGAVTEVLLRLDGDRIVLDPVMIFTPENPSAEDISIAQLVPSAIAPQAGAPLQPETVVVSPGASSLSTPASGIPPLVWWAIGISVLLLVLALWVGVLRRKAGVQ